MKSLLIIWIAVLLSGASLVVAVDYGTRPAHAYADTSAKYDGDCQPGDTAGRCSDKCPPPEYLQGYDKDTGAAVCSDPPTGCPYAEQVPTGPQCDALAPAAAQPPQDIDIAPLPAFAGK